LPVLCEDEQVLVKWIIDSSQKEFPQRLGVQLRVKEFLTINQRKTPFKVTMPGNGQFQAFLDHHAELPTHTSESVTSSSATLGETEITKW
jgi:hypothetical protein